LSEFRTALREQSEGFRAELREQNRRQERILQEMFDQLGSFMATQTRLTEEVVSGLGEVREETRAQREALLAVLDRLPPPSGSN
jgi:hypothetical protein